MSDYVPDRTPWVVVNFNLGNALACMRCGQWYAPAYPIPVDLMTALSKTFCEMHEYCVPHLLGDPCPYCMRWHPNETCTRGRTTQP